MVASQVKSIQVGPSAASIPPASLVIVGAVNSGVRVVVSVFGGESFVSVARQGVTCVSSSETPQTQGVVLGLPSYTEVAVCSISALLTEICQVDSKLEIPCGCKKMEMEMETTHGKNLPSHPCASGRLPCAGMPWSPLSPFHPLVPGFPIPPVDENISLYQVSYLPKGSLSFKVASDLRWATTSGRILILIEMWTPTLVGHTEDLSCTNMG